MRMLGRAGLAFALVASHGRAAPQQTVSDPTIEPRIKALFDQPMSSARAVLPSRPNDPNSLGVVRCYYYPDLTVKELDYGDHGDTAISVTPFAVGSVRPRCGKQNDPGEIVLPGGEASYFIGTKGGFLYVGSTMKPGLVIYDGRTGKAIYSDQASDDSPTSFSVENGILTLQYTHVAQTNCSILTGGQNCWAKFAHDTHLPQPVAKLPPPLAACEAGYNHSANSVRDTPSVIFYNVTMTLDKKGQAKVLSRGVVSCEPQG